MNTDGLVSGPLKMEAGAKQAHAMGSLSELNHANHAVLFTNKLTKFTS